MRMPKLVIHQEKVEDPQVLVDICPFGAMEEKDGKLSINAACKMCKLCVKKGPAGAVEYVEDEKKEEIDKQNKLLQQLKGRESVTKDGQKIELCANIGSVLDVGNVLKNDAEGIGLFRSEFLYLESNDYPSEDVQFAAYKDVLSKIEFMAISIALIKILFFCQWLESKTLTLEDCTEIVKNFSKEIEYSEDNLQKIEDIFYDSTDFSINNIIGIF